jgi:hypothetical protein
VCITWLLQEVQELDVVYSSLQALLLPVHQSSVIVVDDDDDHQQPPTRRPKRKASPPIVDEDEPPLTRIPKAKSSLPPTTVTVNDDEQPPAQRIKREAPPPSDVWSIMTSKDMPQTRKPQFGHLKGKALYHQVKELPLWVMMQDFALWFSTKDIILQWLSVVHGINPNRNNTKVDPDPMLTAMAKYAFPPPVNREPNVRRYAALPVACFAPSRRRPLRRQASSFAAPSCSPRMRALVGFSVTVCQVAQLPRTKVHPQFTVWWCQRLSHVQTMHALVRGWSSVTDVSIVRGCARGSTSSFSISSKCYG